MRYLMLKFEKDWADEFDIKGFCVMTEERWNAKKLELDIFWGKVESGWECSMGFGTNQEVGFSSAKDVLSSIREVEITKSQYDAVEDLFDGSYGHMPYISYETTDDYVEWYLA
jgi:hypothetical protein